LYLIPAHGKMYSVKKTLIQKLSVTCCRLVVFYGFLQQ